MPSSANGLTLEEKVGQLFFIGIPGPELDAQTVDLLDEIRPGGVCLFARNIREAYQTRELLDGLRARSPLEPFLSVDQEGGLVDRLRRILAPMPAAQKMRNAEDARRLARIIAEALRLLGFNMNFAPVVDVIDAGRASNSNGLFSREFGRSKEDVVELAGAFMNELHDGGVVGCLKHFPGLGAAQVDSHEELPQVDISESEFEATDLYPYRQLLERAPAVMMAHAAFPAVTLQEEDRNGKLLPSSLSNNFIDSLLRGRLGFDGVVITDDLEMGAILKNYGIGDACKMALNAGVDMLAICADPGAIREGYRAVLTSVEIGELPSARLDASRTRIAALRGKLTRPLAFNSARLSEISMEIEAFAAELG